MKDHAVLGAVFESFSDPLMMLDRDMRIQLANAAAKTYYNITDAHRITGVCCHDALGKGSRACTDCKIREAVRHGRHLCHERKGFMDPDRLEQVTIYPVADDGPNPGHAIIRIHDITGLRRMEAELAQADKMISLGVLVSGMAHEINNPNNFIMLNTPLLINAWDAMRPILDQYYRENGEFNLGGLAWTEIRDELPEMLRGIGDSSARIKRITRDLKEFAQKEHPGPTAPVEINRVVERAVRLNRKLLRTATHRFTLDLAKGLPAIKGSRQQLEQVVINLIQNACQALENPDQGIGITTALEGENVIVTVSDQGRGIPEALLPRILDPFFTTRRHEGGTGLGLSVTANIIRNHGGAIKAENAPERGARFRVSLPVSPSTEKIKVLIADDDEGSRQVVRAILQRSGRFELAEAASGRETMDHIERERPALVILDVHMPGLDGTHVCGMLRSRPDLRAIKVMIITGFVGSEKTETIRQMGCDIILDKPVEAGHLRQAVDRLLEGE